MSRRTSPAPAAMPRRSLRQVLATQRVLFEREVLANSEVVHPQRARPRRIGPGLALVEEQHVSLHPTGVEDSGRQPKQRMHVELSEQAASYDLTRPALEQHVAGNGGPRARDVRAHAAAASRRRRDELRGTARRGPPRGRGPLRRGRVHPGGDRHALRLCRFIVIPPCPPPMACRGKRLSGPRPRLAGSATPHGGQSRRAPPPAQRPYAPPRVASGARRAVARRWRSAAPPVRGRTVSLRCRRPWARSSCRCVGWSRPSCCRCRWVWPPAPVNSAIQG